MTWGSYYFYYDCPNCGRRFCWELADMTDKDFSSCPNCSSPGVLIGETKDNKQGENKFTEYES